MQKIQKFATILPYFQQYTLQIPLDKEQRLFPKWHLPENHCTNRQTKTVYLCFVVKREGAFDDLYFK